MENKRIEYIDFIKGVCIFLVVWAHSIQNMSPNNTFWENPVHIFISSFHMPIFMLLSGFFFNHTFSKNTSFIIKKKFLQLIIPCFGWSIILVSIQSTHSIYNGEPISFFSQIKQLFYETGTRFWFLRSVFICYVLASISMKVLKNDYLACFISFIIFLLISDNFRLALDKFMYPYFWAGYFFRKYMNYINRQTKNILISSFILFVILLFFWKKEDYIYQTGMSFYNISNGQIIFYPFYERAIIILFRYLIGFSGSIFFFLLLKQLYNPLRWGDTILKNWGQYTLGIYVIHIFITGLILSHLNLSHTNFILFNFVITPITAILLITFCITLIKLLQKNKFLSFLFLGRK